jgi:nitrite reductase/ring-hydroxylating ferredoxin subunit
MRFAFIAAKKAEHTVTILCRCMRVTRSGFYAWARRGLSARAQRDLMRTKLRAFHAASGDRSGRPRLWKDLREDGGIQRRQAVLATHARCTHRRGPLSEGTLDGSTVTCPCHGSQFNVCTGAAVKGPAEDPLATYRVTVEGEIGRVDVPLAQAVQGA